MKGRRVVRRVYVRYAALSEDLFVPTDDAIEVGELKVEAAKRLIALGISLPCGLKV